ncbi:MAG: hypothetical protein KDK66_04375 [Deltaproteobacteria bacterium]|nr:hypothetical protein [Deltaproteobacteria bacterium]
MFELDPLYHTESMVKLLKEQGSPQLARDLAKKILEKNPHLDSVRTLLSQLEEEAEANFEKFLQKGREHRETSQEAKSSEVKHEQN